MQADGDNEFGGEGEKEEDDGEKPEEGPDAEANDIPDEGGDVESEPKSPRPDAKASAFKRLVSQRANNHKVLQRLNAEILGYQANVRSFLKNNRVLIPSVSGDKKAKVFNLLMDYATETKTGVQQLKKKQLPHAEFLKEVGKLALLVPFAQPRGLAITVCVKSRVLKLAALYDFALTKKILAAEVFDVIRKSFPKGTDPILLADAESLFLEITNELASNIAEANPEDGKDEPRRKQR